MVLLSCSDTGGGLYANLAKRRRWTQLLSGFPHPQFIGVTISLRVVNKHIIVNTLNE